MIQPYLINSEIVLQWRKQPVSGHEQSGLHYRGRGSCVGGLHDRKSFRSFMEKGVALKELIYTWSSNVRRHTLALRLPTRLDGVRIFLML